MNYAKLGKFDADGKTNLQHGFFLQDMIRMGLPIGRFGPSGWFPYMIFGLPFAALAMLMSVPKENRKKVRGIYLSAGLTSMLTGITEPIEIPFYFANPILFYAVYIPICGISGFFTNLFHVSVPSVFGGIIELFSWGVLPTFSGHNTHFWVIPLVGLPLGAIFFFAFLFLVLKLNIKVAGRENVVGDPIKFASFRSWREHIFGVKYTTSGEVIDDPKKRKDKKK
jgi:phosphotransferase system  glucose/maltose/N-acetylglucosamine-specific IIC component